MKKVLVITEIKESKVDKGVFYIKFLDIVKGPIGSVKLKVNYKCELTEEEAAAVVVGQEVVFDMNQFAINTYENEWADATTGEVIKRNVSWIQVKR